MSYVTPCSFTPNYSDTGMGFFSKENKIGQINIEEYSKEEYDKVLKRHNQALRYQKLITVFKAETIDFEIIKQVQEKRTRHEPVE